VKILTVFATVAYYHLAKQLKNLNVTAQIYAIPCIATGMVNASNRNVFVIKDILVDDVNLKLKVNQSKLMMN
jgi:hypothetical protein